MIVWCVIVTFHETTYGETINECWFHWDHQLGSFHLKGLCKSWRPLDHWTWFDGPKFPSRNLKFLRKIVFANWCYQVKCHGIIEEANTHFAFQVFVFQICCIFREDVDSGPAGSSTTEYTLSAAEGFCSFFYCPSPMCVDWLCTYMHYKYRMASL